MNMQKFETEEASAAWKAYWQRDHFWPDADLWRANAEFFSRSLKRLAGIEASDRVLDIGCGAGHLAKVLAPQTVQVHGVDTSERFIERARAACAEYPNAQFRLFSGDDEDLIGLRTSPCRFNEKPAGDEAQAAGGGKYSLFLCVSVIQYYRDIEQVRSLIEACRAAALPGARLVIADIPLRRNAAGRAWDTAVSLAQSFKEGYAREFIGTAWRLAMDSDYSRFAQNAPVLEFTESSLQSLLNGPGYVGALVRGGVTVNANRPAMVIRFKS